ncbi:helix-turn-helix domain-containing protein [Nocardia alni]|uniref:helix-turn-helix domain-containing protein n=1 Tax=Nocardia alni TaxID=2815723 RepID=UPI0027E0DE10|nr:helix-turn-helix transcriptional regulator [Nocardia alni]
MSSTPATLLVAARRNAGLTQSQLAGLANTSQSAVAAYESGRRQPTIAVLDRLLRAAGFQLSLGTERRADLLRLADLAPLIAAAVDDAHRLRLFFEFLRGADEAGAELPLLIAAEPAPVGDPRYDALLAATAEHLALHAGFEVPDWVLSDGRCLDRFWWVSELPSAKAQALLHSPASFRSRGVMLDSHDLEAA